jgi:hypothetical protein
MSYLAIFDPRLLQARNGVLQYYCSGCTAVVFQAILHAQPTHTAYCMETRQYCKFAMATLHIHKRIERASTGSGGAMRLSNGDMLVGARTAKFGRQRGCDKIRRFDGVWG